MFVGFTLKQPPPKATASKIAMAHPFLGLSMEARKPLPRIPDAQALATFVAQYQTIDPNEHARVRKLEQHFNDEEQTTNPEWLDARKHRITGSVMGVVGHCNPYETIEYFLKKKVWEWQMDERGKANCRYGNLHEPVAEEAFAAYTATFIDVPDERGWTLRNFRIQELGLYVCKAPGHAMLGMSPDGVLHTTWEDPDGKTVKKVELIEYKCPATWQKKMGNPGIYKHNMLPQRFPTGMRDSLGEYPPSDWLPRRRRLPLPPYYNAQVQYGMELFRRSGVTMDRCHFVVWTPQRTSVTVVDRDAMYGEWLLARGKQFWEDVYAKNVVLKATGKLNTDEVLPNGE